MSETPLAESAVEKPKRIVVAGIIVRDGKVLVVHNIKRGLRIEPPGGKQEQGETMEQAIVRELFEELGITVRVTGNIGAYPTDSPEGEFIVHTFLCEIVEGEPTEGLEKGKIGNVEWKTPDELATMPELVKSLRDALPDIRALLAAA